MGFRRHSSGTGRLKPSDPTKNEEWKSPVVCPESRAWDISGNVISSTTAANRRQFHGHLDPSCLGGV
jgi:hypothetical protein